jgi:hypothetical protein
MIENTQFFVDREVIILTRNGIWLADGTEITHEPTRRLFARSLKKDEKGYFLQIGRETKRIEVEDTAYFIQRIDGDPNQGFRLSINDETQESLNPATLKYRPGRLTCQIKGNPAEEAKFLHSAYFDLLKDLQEDSKSYFLEFGGKNRIRVTLAQK